MARKEYQEEGLRLLIEFGRQARQNARSFNKSNEQIAEQAEETAKRVTKAGEQIQQAYRKMAKSGKQPLGISRGFSGESLRKLLTHLLKM